MSYADKIFIENCRDILENGFSTENEKVRPVWDDGTPAYTIKKFGVVNRYDLSKEFPILTLRYTNWKAAIDEMLWIWQKKSNKVSDLNSHIWDSWMGEDGTIGKAYGYQLGIKHEYKEGMFDQVDRVLYDLKNNPYSMTFNVVDGKLNAILNQRSQDTLAANNWNIVQYSVLVHMFAQVSGLEVGELVHVIADMHIYDRHIPLIKKLIEREPLPAPKFEMNKDIKNFYDFTVDDFNIIDYKHGESIGRVPVAV